MEIERKFICKDTKEFYKESPIIIEQGYLAKTKEYIIRVRHSNKGNYINIKSNQCNISRTEYEFAISEEVAITLLHNFCSNIISKERYKYYYDNKCWEIDKFLGDNEGLIIAEIELDNEFSVFKIPDFIEKEVTGNPLYYNANIANNPYKNWKNK